MNSSFHQKLFQNNLVLRIGDNQRCQYSCRSSQRRYSIKKDVLKSFTIFTGKHLCWSLFLITLQAFRLETLLKGTPTQVFSCEYCEIFKNSYFEEHLRMATFVHVKCGGNSHMVTFFISNCNMLI